MSEVLFEITKENLETGLRGYPVGYCVTSTVDPLKGLFYVGHSLADIAFWKPEKVIYLLFTGHEGSQDEIKRFFLDLQNRAKCSPDTIRYIQQLPRQGNPMKLFSMALLQAGIFEGKGDYREDALNLIAKVPEIAATVIAHHAGWTRNASRPELGYMENFTQMLNPPNADSKKLTEIFSLFNVLHYDHGGGNLSAFVGKCVASGLEDLYGSICAAMCALAGPKHGKANQDCLQFVQEVVDELGENGTPEQVEQLIRQRLQNNRLIFGFGHAVLRIEDPRATVFFTVAQKQYAAHPLVKIANILRTVGPKVLRENPKISDPYPNVDSISGTVLSAAGFPYPEYFTVLFGLARTVGISTQILYERLEARDGKGTPIVRPKYLYKQRSIGIN